MRSSKGFTLIELIVSLGLLAIISTAIITTFVLQNNMYKDSQEHKLAKQFVSIQLNYLEEHLKFTKGNIIIQNSNQIIPNNIQIYYSYTTNGLVQYKDGVNIENLVMNGNLYKDYKHNIQYNKLNDHSIEVVYKVSKKNNSSDIYINVNEEVFYEESRVINFINEVNIEVMNDSTNIMGYQTCDYTNNCGRVIQFTE